MTDAGVIDAGEGRDIPMVARWGQEWSDLIRGAVAEGHACDSYNAGVIGQAVAGALHQAALETSRSQECRVELADNLSRFLLRALKPA
jgi:hypothetical protein